MVSGVNNPTSRPNGDHRIWAITSYFNPAGYRNRRRNYRIFRQRLNVPLLTVELGYAAAPELGEGDADVLVQLRGGDILWQKERLLNVALRALPAGCEKVAWIDGDVIFARPDWPHAASRLLDRAPLVQLFHQRHNLPAGSLPELTASAGAADVAHSIAYELAHRRVSPQVIAEGSIVGRWGIMLGLAWAARRDLLETHGLYDAGILGGGDRALAAAAFAQFDALREAWCPNPRQLEHFHAWARPFHEAVRGQVEYVEGAIHHLWHGDRKDRRYRTRYADFRRFDFDPFRDIAVDSNGSWRWSTDKPDMHRYVENYFLSRREDG